MIQRICLLLATLTIGHAAHASPEPIEHVDLSRYLGRWHQIASIPAFFQRDCALQTTADYSAGDNGEIKVINSCKTADGSLKTAEGRARINPRYDRPSQLQVTFVRIFGKWIWPLAGDYWIIDLGGDYEYSVVGHPEYKYGWILSRTPSLPLDTLRGIEQRLKRSGYNTCDFILSETETQKPRPGSRLCDL